MPRLAQAAYVKMRLNRNSDIPVPAPFPLGRAARLVGGRVPPDRDGQRFDSWFQRPRWAGKPFQPPPGPIVPPGRQHPGHRRARRPRPRRAAGRHHLGRTNFTTECFRARPGFEVRLRPSSRVRRPEDMIVALRALEQTELDEARRRADRAVTLEPARLEDGSFALSHLEMAHGDEHRVKRRRSMDTSVGAPENSCFHGDANRPYGQHRESPLARLDRQVSRRRATQSGGRMLDLPRSRGP